jgi:hypothetical protein
LNEEFERWLSSVCPSPQTPPEEWLDKVDEAYRHLRISVSRATLERRLTQLLMASGLSEAEAQEILASPDVREAQDPTKALLSAVTRRLASSDSKSGPAELDAPAISDALHHLERLSSGWVSACNLRATVEKTVRAGRGGEAVKALREGLRAMWAERIVPIFDSHATGDQVIDRLTREVAPGRDVRILGCQNIKGTGLDFAYRWISVDEVARALARLYNDPDSRSETLRWLMSHGDYGLLDVRAAVRQIDTILKDEDPGWALVRTELEGAKSLLERVQRDKISKLDRAPTQSRFARMLSAVEPLVDHLDSIRRSRWAARVMDDLYEQRISQSRAAVLLREVTGRGKGGWLAADWQKWRSRNKARSN